MGHVRLGRLAKSQSWQHLVALLDLPDVDVASVAATTANGAQARLLDMRRDPVLGYTFWLMSRVATAARSGDLIAHCRHFGLEIGPGDSAISVIAKISDLTRVELERHPQSGPFGEIASLALRRTLLETLGQHQTSLFGKNAQDLERAIRTRTTDRAFGELSVRFFGDLLGRTLRYYIDKELPFHIGADSGFRDIDASDAFLRDLDTYTWQSARIVKDFATDWLSKNTFAEDGMISREQAQGFVSHAMEKLDAELRLEPVA